MDPLILRSIALPHRDTKKGIERHQRKRRGEEEEEFEAL